MHLLGKLTIEQPVHKAGVPVDTDEYYKAMHDTIPAVSS